MTDLARLTATQLTVAYRDGSLSPGRGDPGRAAIDASNDVGETNSCVVTPAEPDAQPDPHRELVRRRGHLSVPLLELLGRRWLFGPNRHGA